MTHTSSTVTEQVQKETDSLRRIMEHLPDGGDLTLVVLKGHLLIEEMLTKLVAARMKRPKAIDEARLGFFKLACVAKGLDFEEQHTVFWDAAFKLNELRNSLAHGLEAGNHNKKLREFASVLSGADKGAEDEFVKAPVKTMVNTLATMCGFFAGAADKALKERPASWPPA